MAKRKNLFLGVILCALLTFSFVFAVTFVSDAQETASAASNPDYLCFTAEEAGVQISMRIYNSPSVSIETSTDLTNWTAFVPGTTVITLTNVGDKVYFRGNNPDGFNSVLSTLDSDKNYAYFNLSKKAGASGNVMSLISNDCSCLEIPNNYCFYYLFFQCANLTSAPTLPATTLKENCYDSIFYGCTNLEAAPALPAQNLEKKCYYSMFNGCSLIQTAPVLSAVNLADYCYQNMLYGCTALTKAPELPATTLKPYCYASMFAGCENLTAAPVLPATELANNCYYSMFSNCKKIQTAPALPAVTLVTSCYNNMFNNCISLTEAPTLPATVLTENCYNNMFKGCAALQEAPVLTAEVMRTSCYSGMFYDCAALQEAPVLCSTTLAKNCYNNMFRGCKLLQTAPVLPAMNLAEGCYENMFYGCENLTEAPVLPAQTLARNCYYAMFQGCKLLETAPVLQATTLMPGSYSNMFRGCSKLDNIVMLATDVSALNCLTGWVTSVQTTSGTFNKAAGVSIPNGNSGIPNNWTVTENYIVSLPVVQNAVISVDKSYISTSSFVADSVVVSMNVAPSKGYILKENSLKATYNDGTEQTINLEQNAQDKTKYSFKMPAANVTIAAEIVPITIDDMLPSDFPQEKENGWKNDSGASLYIGDGSLYINDSKFVDLTERIYYSLDTYTYYWSATVGGVTLKIDFNTADTTPAITNVTISGSPVSEINGTYAKCVIVEKPTADTTKYTYTGEEITYNVPASDYYTVSGNVQTEAGKYTVTVSLSGGCRWADGTTDNLLFEFNINKADNVINVLSLDSWKFGETASTLTAEAEFGNVEILYSLADVRNFEIEEMPSAIGKYIVKAFVLGTDNYNAIDKELEFSIYQRAEDLSVVDENNQPVENSSVLIIGTENGIDPEAVFVVKVLNVENSDEATATVNALKAAGKLTDNGKVYCIYDAKLVANDTDIQPDGKITMKMLVPEELIGKEFKLYHIHNGNEVSAVEYSDIDEDGFITFETDKFSQFAFITEDQTEFAVLSAGAVAGIIIGAIIAAVIIAFVLGKAMDKIKKPLSF